MVAKNFSFLGSTVPFKKHLSEKTVMLTVHLQFLPEFNFLFFIICRENTFSPKQVRRDKFRAAALATVGWERNSSCMEESLSPPAAFSRHIWLTHCPERFSFVWIKHCMILVAIGLQYHRILVANWGAKTGRYMTQEASEEIVSRFTKVTLNLMKRASNTAL